MLKKFNYAIHKHASIGICLLGLLSSQSATAEFEDKYWVGAADGVWEDASNWSLTSGGLSGATPPEDFDNAFIDAAVTITYSGLPDPSLDLELFRISAATFLHLSGRISTEISSIDINSNASYIQEGGVLIGDGNLEISGSFWLKGGLSGNIYTVLTGANYVQDGGTHRSSDLVLNSASVYTLNNGAVILNDDLALNNASTFLQTGGSIDIYNSFDLRTSSNYNISSGSLITQNLGMHLFTSSSVNQSGGTVDISFEFRANDAEYNLTGGQLDTTRAFDDAFIVDGGSVNVTGATAEWLVGTANVSGADSVITLSDDGSIQQARLNFSTGGTLNADGNIQGSINNISGQINPGSPLGSIELDGNLNNIAGGVQPGTSINIELGGTLNGEFDTIVATGTVLVGNDLNVSLVNGYTPTTGDNFNIISASTVTGLFDVTNLPALAADKEWEILYSPSAVQLVVNAVIVDSDGDGIIDSEDNCPVDANPGQEDHEGDDIGDICDNDDDNDTVVDTVDNCPLTANTDQDDLDGDNIGDVCDSDIDGDGTDNIGDCNSTDATISPGATEIKHDGIDQDCNGYDLTIDIIKAIYNSHRNKLKIKATSTLSRSAALVVDGFGAMKYKTR